jgi:hypothetical protein
MNAFLKTLFGDARTVSIVIIIMITQVALVCTDQTASAAFAIPALVLAGTAWLATR